VDELTRLALAAAEGDRTALTVFVRKSQADVWRLCAYLADRDRADDLTQETYLRAITALRTYRGDSSARTWLLSIARHTVLDSFRRSARQRRLTDRLKQRRQPTDEDHAGRTELEVLVDGLAEDRRSAFVLTQVLGLGYAEAAEVCGCPIGTIRSRVARAREELTTTLLDDRADDGVDGGGGGHADLHEPRDAAGGAEAP
jgi:RNA polymerase sigma-70 factor (ECF subfamily)